ncbi:nuclear transport factor 2 family protein [Nocardia sp. NPDC004860]|uniref:nuclear transport factor 2 family protein n=1 Tax=Nocardia sp. NPDC004860 TaxID=3154557 RepID=UPI0033B62E56
MPRIDQIEVGYWVDTARITKVFNGYFRALDEMCFDVTRFEQIFASNGRIVRPNGVAVAGPASIAGSHAVSFARFDATQHLLSGHDVAIDGDTADVRANLVAIHLWKGMPVESSMLERSFTAGGVVTADLARTPDGWRMTEVRNRIIWRAGHFGDMIETR